MPHVLIRSMKPIWQVLKVTKERIYIETIEDVYSNIEKIIIDDESGGVVPYLPLQELKRSSRRGQNETNT